MLTQAKDYSDWTRQNIDLQVSVRFRAAEDDVVGPDISIEETLQTPNYRDAMFSLAGAATTTIGTIGIDIKALFLQSDIPVNLTVGGTTFDGVTFIYMLFPDASGIEQVGIENASISDTVKISALLVEG